MWIGPEDHKLVGDHLASARRTAGVTQQELAARLAKPQSFVSSYESGQRRIDVLEFLAIVAAIGGNAQKVFATIAASAKPIVKRTLKRGRKG